MNEAEEKELLLERIRTLASREAVSKGEIDAAYYKGLGDKAHPVHAAQGNRNAKIGMAEVLYYVGGAIVFLGIFISSSHRPAT